MSDHYYSGSYRNSYQQVYPYNPSIPNYEAQYGKSYKPSQNYDIKGSNISQQTIIHRARLYSPNKDRQTGKNSLKSTINYERTKQKKTQIASKIHEIVDLCQNDRDAEIQQFKDVLVAQKRILNMLEDREQIDREVPNIDLSHFGDPHYDRGTTFGPIRHNNNVSIPKVQSRQTTQRQVIQNYRQTGPRQNIYKKSAIDDLKTDRNPQQPYQPNIQGQIKRISQYNGPFNDQTEKIIQEIQRKAMEQIQSLRNDKIELMRRLNQQIKAHNEQKKIRMQLQEQLARIKGYNNIPNRTGTHQNQHVSPAPISHGVHQKQQQKYYSQPHFKQQPKQRIPPQTFYPPPSYQPEQTNKIYNLQRPHSPQHQSLQYNQQQHNQQTYLQRNQYQQQPSSQPNLQNYQKQLRKLQIQNQQLMQKVTRNQNQSYGSKQDLRQQVIQLNHLISQYQYQIQRLRRNQGSSDLSQLENLLVQGQKIELQTLRLLQQNVEQQQNQTSRNLRGGTRQVPTSQNILEDTNNFKRRLIQAENSRSNRKASLNFRSDSYQNIGSGSSIPKFNNFDNESNRILEFERFLGDLRNAAR